MKKIVERLKETKDERFSYPVTTESVDLPYKDEEYFSYKVTPSFTTSTSCHSELNGDGDLESKCTIG